MAQTTKTTKRAGAMKRLFVLAVAAMAITSSYADEAAAAAAGVDLDFAYCESTGEQYIAASSATLASGSWAMSYGMAWATRKVPTGTYSARSTTQPTAVASAEGATRSPSIPTAVPT